MMTTEALEKKLKEVKQRREGNLKDIETIRERISATKERQEELSNKYEEARVKRQEILATGMDAKQTNKLIKDLKDEQELIEDELIGLDQRFKNLEAEGESLEKKETETEKNILQSKLIPLAGEYNIAAAELATIVKKIWELRIALNEGYTGTPTILPSMGWDENALTCIPKMYLPHEEIPQRGSRTGAFFLFGAFREDYQRKIQEEKERAKLIKKE
jgi:DNA repair exonuclease SbcCD ATPase subunit